MSGHLAGAVFATLLLQEVLKVRQSRLAGGATLIFETELISIGGGDIMDEF